MAFMFRYWVKALVKESNQSNQCLSFVYKPACRLGGSGGSGDKNTEIFRRTIEPGNARRTFGGKFLREVLPCVLRTPPLACVVYLPVRFIVSLRHWRSHTFVYYGLSLGVQSYLSLCVPVSFFRVFSMRFLAHSFFPPYIVYKFKSNLDWFLRVNVWVKAQNSWGNSRGNSGGIPLNSR